MCSRSACSRCSTAAGHWRPRSPSWLRALRWATLAAAALACAGEPVTPSALPLNEFPFATAYPDCAPWDGPAVSIVLTSALDTAETETPPLVRVMVYDTAERLVGRTTVWPNEAEVGSAVWCVADGDCAVADSGVVVLERLSGDTALVGRLRLVFVQRGLLDGAFHARWRPRIPLCG